MAVDIIARAMAAEASSGGKDVDYGSVTNKPQINGITLEGNKTTSDLGIGEIIELKGTEENPIELANIGEPGIYKISGYVKDLLTSLAADIGNDIILEVAKTNDAISQHYWEGNSAFRMKVRVTISGLPFTENFHELSQDGDIENYDSINNFSLITSLTLSSYLGRGYSGKVLLTYLKTTDKKSLVNAINELVDIKQDKLTAGSGITIENNVISALGGGNTEVKILSGDYYNPIKLYEITEQGKYLINGYAKETERAYSSDDYGENKYILIVLNVNNTIFQYIVGIFNSQLRLEYRIGTNTGFIEKNISSESDVFEPFNNQAIYSGKQIGEYYGNKYQLNTTDKTSLVNAINEVNTKISSGTFATNLTEVQGYDATKTQVLKNISGQFMWVDEN